MQRERQCPNFNHRRANAPVRHCPMCGEIVNASIREPSCVSETHAKRRRDRDAYCLDCGVTLKVT